MSVTRWTIAACIAAWSPLVPAAEERLETFDRDPGWDSRNGRAAEPRPRPVKQDFGWSNTARAGGRFGEIGGLISPAAEPAYCAKRIPERTFRDRLSASGSFAGPGRPCHVLVGFFDSKSLGAWRTPNTIALRIGGRGDFFYAWLEYATSRYRAGGDSPRGFAVRDPGTGRPRATEFAGRGVRHTWSLAYDPGGNGGGGSVTAAIDGETAICNLRPGHQDDGAVFDRFGILTVMKSADAGGELWLGDLVIDGRAEDLSRDPGWEGVGNRREYVSELVRPRFDFGFSPTRFAGGRAEGELGGTVFRGDCRFPGKLASCGDRLDGLTLDRPLRASGRVAFVRGVSDSTVLLGFYHSRESVRPEPSQDSMLPRSFLGIAVEGPSREGFFFAPAYRMRGGEGRLAAAEARPPHILPDSRPRSWTLSYSPPSAGAPGRLDVALDGEAVRLDLDPRHATGGTSFDRFGIVSTWIDGNWQQIFFDDLSYTCRQ